MPKSKTRRRTAAGRSRDKAGQRRVRETQAAQDRAETRRITPAQYRRRRIIGWTLVVLAAVVFAQHLVSHMGFFTLISPGWDDLVAGYPLALALAAAGAIILTKS